MSFSEKDLHAIVPHAIKLQNEADTIHCELGLDPPRFTYNFTEHGGDANWNLTHLRIDTQSSSVQPKNDLRRFGHTALIQLPLEGRMRIARENAIDFSDNDLMYFRTRTTITEDGTTDPGPLSAVFYGRQGFETSDFSVLSNDHRFIEYIGRFMALSGTDVVIDRISPREKELGEERLRQRLVDGTTLPIRLHPDGMSENPGSELTTTVIITR